MKRLSLIFAVAAVVAVWPASSGAATFTGVVVAKQHGALLVASPAGVVTAVAGRASIGSRITVSGSRVTVVGRAHVARVRGIVVRRVGATMFLSSNRHLVAVHTGRVLASVSDTTPPPATPAPTTPATTPATGDIVSAQVTIGSGGELNEDSSENLGSSNASSLQVQAVVAAVGTGTVTLTVGTQTLTVPLPAGLTLPASMVGQTVTLSLDLNGQSGQNGDDSNDNNDSNDDGDNGSSGSGGSGGSGGSSGSGSFGGGGNGG